MPCSRARPAEHCSAVWLRLAAALGFLAALAPAATARADAGTDFVNDSLFHVFSGTRTVARLIGSDPNLLLGTALVDANATLSVTMIRQDVATVGGTLVIRSGPPKTTSVVAALNIAGSADAWTGVVNIGTNALVVACGPSVDANAVYSRLANQARFASNNLVWDRAGLTSSAAQADTRHLTAVAVVLNRDDSATDPKPAFLTVFDATPDANFAVAVNTQSILVKYTYYGDADLNGVVDERDLDRFSTGYSDQRSAAPRGLVGWAWGDFDNNGSIDERDLDLFSTAYSNHGAPLSSGAVPEPATLMLLATWLGLLAGRRRPASR
jgi:hypothetical protein